MNDADDEDIRTRTERLLHVDPDASTKIHLVNAQALLSEYMDRFEEVDSENTRLRELLGDFPDSIFAQKGQSVPQVLQRLLKRIERLRIALYEIEQHKSMQLDLAPSGERTIREIVQAALSEETV